MLSKNEQKYYASLLKKKYRREEGKFIAEGKKIIEEGLGSALECELLFHTPEFAEQDDGLLKVALARGVRVETLPSKEFEKLSDTQSPQGVAGVFATGGEGGINLDDLDLQLVVALDDISDPGNLGAILRTSDWFGVRDVLLSSNSVELYNPKVIRSSMGSIFRSRVTTGVSFETELPILKEQGYSILCADTDGKDIFSFQPPAQSVLALSNESEGPSESVVKAADEFVTIPRIGGAESLNVASASAILLAWITHRLSNGF